jgi:hypothetical protein
MDLFPPHATTDDRGEFALEGVSLSRLELTAFADGFAPSRPCGVQAVVQQPLRIVLEPGRTATLTLDVPAARPDELYLRLWPQGSEGALLPPLHDVGERRRFECRGLPAGPYLVSVTGRNEPFRSPVLVNMAPGEPCTLALEKTAPGGTVHRGRLVDEAGAPCAGVLVHVNDLLEPQRICTDADGRFEFTSRRPAGMQVCVALAPGQPWAFVNAERRVGAGAIEVPADVELTEIRTRPLLPVRGRVLTASGRPFEEVAVRVPGTVTASGTDLDGAFELCVERGADVPLRIEVHRPPLSLVREVPLRAGAVPEKVEIRLPDPATIEGIVVNGSGEPVVGVAIHSAALSDHPRIVEAGGVAWTGRDGRFRFRPVLPGRWRLVVHPDVQTDTWQAPSLERGGVMIRVASGETVEVRIEN